MTFIGPPGTFDGGSATNGSSHGDARVLGLPGRQPPGSGTAFRGAPLVHSRVVPTRLGLFGGTFDPPHVGHMVAAVNVRRALHLDEVLLMVANDPWQKSNDPVSPAVDRLAMTRAAASGIEGLSVRDDEIVRGGPTYTVDTVERLLSGAKTGELQVFTIIGADTAARFHTWKRAADVAELTRLVVVNRADQHALVSGGFECEMVEIPSVDVSSTEVRARVRRGESVHGLVRDAVAEIITVRGLYRESAHAGAAS